MTATYHNSHKPWQASTFNRVLHCSTFVSCTALQYVCFMYCIAVRLFHVLRCSTFVSCTALQYVCFMYCVAVRLFRVLHCNTFVSCTALQYVCFVYCIAVRLFHVLRCNMFVLCWALPLFVWIMRCILGKGINSPSQDNLGQLWICSRRANLGGLVISWSRTAL